MGPSLTLSSQQGDIGPKSGFGFVDNGMLILDHVRVPHINVRAFR